MSGTELSQDAAGHVAQRLNALAPQLAKGGQGISGLKRLTGGASLETWAFDVESPDGVRPLILRRRGDGEEAEVFETSLPLPIEARVLAVAQAAGAPVAELVRDCGPEDGLGEAYIVTRVAGQKKPLVAVLPQVKPLHRRGRFWAVSAARHWPVSMPCLRRLCRIWRFRTRRT